MDKLRGIFSRDSDASAEKPATSNSSSKVICDTDELKDLITRWCENENFKFEDFAKFLDLVRIRIPVQLSELDKAKHSFKCVTRFDKEYTISLYFGDGIDNCSEILVKYGDETKRYVVCGDVKKKPKVELQGRLLEKNGKTLNSYYCNFFCARTLKFGNGYELDIDISEPGGGESNAFNPAVLRNRQQIEDYLINLNSNSLKLSQVYNSFMELLEFSDEDIARCSSIHFSFTREIKKEKELLSEIFKENNKMRRYAIFENGESFQLKKNGDWKYMSEAIIILYCAFNDEYSFTINGAEDFLESVSIAEKMMYVKKKISEIIPLMK